MGENARMGEFFKKLEFAMIALFMADLVLHVVE
jgi:hypothetical protein